MLSSSAWLFEESDRVETLVTPHLLEPEMTDEWMDSRSAGFSTVRLIDEKGLAPHWESRRSIAIATK